MRADYFKDGPPWKGVFMDKKGFVHQQMIRSDKPPEEITFPCVVPANHKCVGNKAVFKLTGVFGNIARYEEK